MSNEAPQPEACEKVSISLPVSVLAVIDRNAAADRRNRSNYIVKTLEDALAEPVTTNTSEQP